ncbi:hypothetical protein [Paucihalobacter sp.]|uniref:hypothetical protein n=1 Tax=Paucihalobacter sp. TaxID=2850405 RepID=UPI003D160BA8
MKNFTNPQKPAQNRKVASKTNNTFNALLLCTLLLFTTKALAQTTHIVNNNAGTAADFTDLQAAIDAAANGDIIHVQQSSTSYGNITLNKELILIGRSHSDPNYKSTVGTIFLADGASNSNIKGLNISNIQDSFTTSNTISNLAITDCFISSITIGQAENYNNFLLQGNIMTSSIIIGAQTANVLITNNIFTASSISFMMTDTLLFTNNILSYLLGVSISNNTPDLLNISNSIFVVDYAFSQPVITLSGSGTFQIANSISYSYDATFSTLNFPTGSNITLTNVQENVNPLFTLRNGTPSSGTLADPNGTQFVPGVDDLTLQAGSPVVDDGLYQGYNFKTFGTPTGIPSLKIDTYSPTVPKNGDLNVTITAKTN